MHQKSVIRVREARQNNLKGFDVELPTGRLIVVTGPSGSGKSSFAFDTVYAEGQRRYVETFSPYTRQFLERMDKPQVGAIEGIPPAIAIEQHNHVKTSRSTVGTVTEIQDYLKILFPRLATGVCPECGREVAPATAASIVKNLTATLPNRQILLVFPCSPGAAGQKNPGDFFGFLRSQGYLRVLLYGKILRTDATDFPPTVPAVVDVIQDRVTVLETDNSRLTEAIEACLLHGQGKFAAVDAETMERFPFSTGWHCAHCDLDLPNPSPGLFSYNNPQGACPTCRGFGRTIGIDYNLALPDRSLSVAEGVVRPFTKGYSMQCQRDLLDHCIRRGIDIHQPFEELTQEEQDFIINGEIRPDLSADDVWEQGGWYGVKGYFDWLESKTYKMHVRVLLSQYRTYRLCPECNGARYRREALYFRLRVPTQDETFTLPQLNALPLHRLLPLMENVEVAPEDRSTFLVLEQIVTRLRYLNQVGLGYLSLDRQSRTLSGGEMQRVNLTTCLGAALVNTLFVMDEPSIGLHARDVQRLGKVMQELRDKGNTLLVVEHEEAIIRQADHLVDIGPGRGVNGGQLIYSGPTAGISRVPGSLTAGYLTGRIQIPLPEKRRAPRDWLRLRGIRHHNLQKLDVDIPLGVFCCVTGVSGSGKSSLVHDVLYRNFAQDAGAEEGVPGFVRKMEIPDFLEDVVLVDQSPLARTPRSAPTLYLDIFDHIRDCFYHLVKGSGLAYLPHSFSFNSHRSERCKRCEGLGYEKVEMQFLSDLYLRCPECEGRRFTGEILNVRLDGKNIADVLDLTAAEAKEFFRPHDPHGKITRPLELLEEVGLEYLKLGQPLQTLSGGEAQRLKLVKRLSQEHADAQATLLILDEPTTGLHFDDVRLLLKVFQRLVDDGHSLLVVEHNLEVIKSADYLLDLGPEAGEFGGRVVAMGTPEEVAQVPESHTGRYLAPYLQRERPVCEPSPPDTSYPAENSTPASPPAILIRGAREHNLKNIDLDIPRDEFVVITGLSGSGKSTLAFDLVFAEGQRRFLDSMSPYARQFAGQLEKPDVDHIEGLPPTVAIEQRVTRGGGKSTVATVTEVYHFLRLLFARLGTQFCPKCNLPVENETVHALATRAQKLLQDGPLRVFAPIIRGRKGLHKDSVKIAQRFGIEFLLVDGNLYSCQEFPVLDRFKEHHVDLLVGEVTNKTEKELAAVLHRATELGDGTARLLDANGHQHLASVKRNCPGCGESFEPLDPRLFSFNSPHGWCPHCRGFGEIWRAEPDNADYESQAERELMEERKYSRLDDGESFTCPLCEGDRLNEVARAVRLRDTNICSVVRGSANQALEWIERLKFRGRDAEIARDLLPEIRQRLRFLNEVGLDYLSLNRSAKTLSGGESQRIRLAAQLGSNLRGVLYVLDEPTIGLHPRDNERLLNSLETLRANGNSLLVVEHDEDTMRRATRIIDLGPGAGKLGGEVIATGTLEEILHNPHSLTGKTLAHPMRHPLHGKRRSLDDAKWIELRGARKHNLKGLNVRFPVARITAVTGVSGSGKSTLVRGVLLPAVRIGLAPGRASASQLACFDSLKGAEFLSSVTEVDQSPIGKTSRSTPATYVKAFDEIRKLFAAVPEARLRGYSPARFSFNTGAGRCGTCEGHGMIKLEMSFLPTSYVPCEECHGLRFNSATLEIRYNGKTIGDVMQMTIAEAADFFQNVPKVARSLRLLEETGLGYLQLGQPSPTLSGGEAQRIKLVAELAARAGQRERFLRTGSAGKSPLLILEEPTIGLHAADVSRLIEVLHRLADEGATIVVIEHHPDLIAEADYIVDLGPEAGHRGGELVACGTPEDVAKVKSSATATVLRKVLRNSPAKPNQKNPNGTKSVPEKQSDSL